MAINFHSQKIAFILKNKSAIRKWILSVLKKEKKTAVNINYIFCSDEYLLDINRKYLKHDFLTDIITFDYSHPPSTEPIAIGFQLNSDIFISVPRVKENAKKFKTPFENELHRVIIHGILHLCGYGDKTEKAKLLMHKKEDECLRKLRLFSKSFKILHSGKRHDAP